MGVNKTSVAALKSKHFSPQIPSVYCEKTAPSRQQAQPLIQILDIKSKCKQRWWMPKCHLHDLDTQTQYLLINTKSKGTFSFFINEKPDSS